MKRRRGSRRNPMKQIKHRQRGGAPVTANMLNRSRGGWLAAPARRKLLEGESLGEALLLWESQKSGKDVVLLRDVAVKRKGNKGLLRILLK